MFREGNAVPLDEFYNNSDKETNSSDALKKIYSLRNLINAKMFNVFYVSSGNSLRMIPRGKFLFFSL